MFSIQEKENIRKFPDCIPNPFVTQDLIFLYPKDFLGQPENTIEILQKIFDLSKVLTGLNPTGKIPSENNSLRITIGFHKGYTQPRWTGKDGNCLYLPWEYRRKKNEPQTICTHELVHPFYRVSELHNGENEV